MWSYEGKVLLSVDGIEMNELLFGTAQFTNRFPVDQIKSVEIIWGPGSAIYGGFAGLNVINIVTKKSADYNSGSLAITSGWRDAYGHNQISGAYGQNKDGFGNFQDSCRIELRSQSIT